MSHEAEARTVPMHLVVRFADNLLGTKDTIREHRELLSRYGSVWFGKFGKPLARARRDALNDQCHAGVPTYLYLVKRVKNRYRVYCGHVKSLSAEPPRQKHLIPDYIQYQVDLGNVRLWMEL